MIIDEKSIPDFDFKIPHRNWVSAFAQLHALLIYAEPGEVICVTGPSRVGKSTLVREVMRGVCGDSNFHKTGKMPFVRVSAANTAQHGTFSTRAFAIRLLNAVEHPIFSAPPEMSDWSGLQQKIDSKRESDIRLILERSFIHRGVRYVVIDEGQHVMFSKKAGIAPHAVLDSWKCMAEDAGIVLVIVGAYPILGILQSSPHLLGRKSQVHFPRYLLADDDVAVFGEILSVYDDVVLPQHGLDSLCAHVELLYRGSLGCLGLLRGWLKRAHAFARLHEQVNFCSILERTVLSDRELVEIEREMHVGERMLISTLGAENAIGDNESAPAVGQEKMGSLRKSSNAKPFQRKPARYEKGNRSKGAS